MSRAGGAPADRRPGAGLTETSRSIMNAFEPAVMAEVARALAEGWAVVALESTLIAQGLPWPANLETAAAAEAAVRRAGAVPATVAVRGGRGTVGLAAAGRGRGGGAAAVVQAG